VDAPVAYGLLDVEAGEAVEPAEAVPPERVSAAVAAAAVAAWRPEAECSLF